MITPVFGKIYPTDTPGALTTAVAQLATAGLIEIMVTLADTVDGEVNAWLLGYDADCGWQPLTMIVCNKRDSPKLSGRNGFRDIEVPTDRFVLLYFPEAAAADVTVACITSYLAAGTMNGSSSSEGIAGLWVPDVPPASPSADDDEFNGPTLNPLWNLHTTGLSANPVVWTPDTIDEGTSETGHIIRYQMGATGNPSAFVVQPGGDITDQAGMSRILDAGTVPTDWIMRAGFSFGVEREAAVSPDQSLLLFMANDDPGNGFGDWDYANFVALFINVDYTGMTVSGGKMISGVYTNMGTGVMLTATTGQEPAQFILKKTGDFYRASVRMPNGQKIVIMSEDLSGQGLSPVRFGLTFTAAANPNPIIPVSYIRHEFAPRGF